MTKWIAFLLFFLASMLFGAQLAHWEDSMRMQQIQQTKCQGGEINE